MMPLLLYDNPTCANCCQVLRKSVVERDALFMSWNVMSFLVFLSGGHPLTVGGEGTPLKLVIPWRTRCGFSLYAWSASDEKAVDTWSRLLLC